MHELSLAMEVVELAKREALKHEVTHIREIIIEVGDLSGVEADAFQFALEMVVRDTILEHATVKLIHTPGKGKCSGCNTEFVMEQRLDTCPGCRCFPSEIIGGQEFRVVSMMVE
jgi:hydrogenase nickel incorporation protein HypA/HybF